MSKKPVTMSVARPSRVAPRDEAPPPPVVAASLAEVAAHTSTPTHAPIVQSALAHVPRVRVGNSTSRLEQGIKRIVVDVAPTVHKQVKVKAIDYPGGIKEYILRLLEADGLDLSTQPDFVPRPK